MPTSATLAGTLVSTMSDLNPAIPKLSVSLALEALSEAAEEVRRCQAITEEKRELRDDLIRNAVRGDEGISARKIARLTGLSRDAVYKILTAGEGR